MLYEIKLKVNKENIKGEVKEVIEHYITNVEYFAEAEAKGVEQYDMIAMCSQSHVQKL